MTKPSEDPRRDMVCFASSFRHEGADNIAHATLDGERTLCGRKGWATSEGWYDFGPDCLRCSRALDRIRSEEPQRDGDFMLGPIRVTKCAMHRGGRVRWRDVWPVVDGDEDVGQSEAEPEVLEACKFCTEQSEVEDLELLQEYG